MSINIDDLRALSPAEKLRILEIIWDDLSANDQEIPLPGWAKDEASRRSQELRDDPSIGLTHDEIWKRIRSRYA